VQGLGATPQAVLVEDGRTIETDLVIVGVGVTPEVELARSGGLTVENGIVTDAYCLKPTLIKDHPIISLKVKTISKDVLKTKISQ
jgi:NADPH-dependent 2,4-dienoyl-CoA reductase/sulfur reductase-like enzyme